MRSRVPVVVAIFAAALVPALARAAVHGTRATAVVSRNANGPSGGGTFSQDGRRVSYFAFSSTASNLVGGDTNGRSDVFLMKRSGGQSGLDGPLTRISVSSGGSQANGDSSNPSVDGDSRHTPHCVAFQSTATNLDPRDASPDWDIYLRNLRSGRTRLVSTDAPTDAVDPVVDGGCRIVTYDSGGTVFVRSLRSSHSVPIAAGDQPDQQTNGKGVAYVRGGQVYYQAFKRARGNVVRQGPERLVSAGLQGPGNGTSSHPSVSDNGDYVAFESTATNLCTGLCRGVSTDENGPVSDIFRRTMNGNAPSHDQMEMASYSAGAQAQGNGPSNDPVISGAGQFIVFDSASTNLRPSAGIPLSAADPNGPTRDVFVWNFRPDRGYGNVSRESRPGATGAFTAPSVAPSISSHGNFIAFTSSATGELTNARTGEPNVLMRFLGGA